MTWTLSNSNPSCCLILPILISAAAGKTSMSAFFTYGKTIWQNRHLMCGSALRKPQLKPLQRAKRALRAALGPSGDTLTLLSHGQQHQPGSSPRSLGPSYHFNLGLPSTPRRRKFRCGDCWLIKLSELVWKKKKGSLKIYIYIYLKYIKMTNSHNPQGLISQQRMLQTSSQNALWWMGWVGGIDPAI